MKSRFDPSTFTPWFPWRIKPVRAGVYMTLTMYTSNYDHNIRVGFARWTGKKWLHSWAFLSSANEYTDPSHWQKKAWCGLKPTRSQKRQHSRQQKRRRDEPER